MDYRKELLAIADKDNAIFSKKLTPGDEHVFLGARVPNIRILAKKIAAGDWKDYLNKWEYEYFEDAMLRGMVIGYAKTDSDTKIKLFGDFVPIINNWAVCDSACSTWKPKKEEKEKVWKFLLRLLKTKKEFQMRFAVVEMMDYFIDDEHIDNLLSLVNEYKHDGYYYKMGVAWCISFCFVKYPEKTMAFLKNNDLDVWTFNKSLQKITESRRVDEKTKKKIKAMRIKQ